MVVRADASRRECPGAIIGRSRWRSRTRMSEPVASSEDRCYRFGVFDFDARALELRKGGRLFRARPQSLKLLTLLLSRAGELVSRDDIQHEL